ncbi:MAG: glycosyltransferase, partial [Eubacterium sp.]|nr:glycosyltransferase [Eubacterium sp.]
DADDLLGDNYCSYIISRADEDWDYMDLSWKSLEDSRYMYRLRNDSDGLSNPSASTRVFKRKFIGNVRFNELKDATEDEDFTRHLGISHARHVCATDILYYYRVTTPGSSYKRFLEGRSETKRIGYYFKYVTKDMTYLIDEFKELDKRHEVMLFTYDNKIPELEPYCQIKTPAPIQVSEMRGDPNNFMKLIPKPLSTQVVVYKSSIKEFGGIETFIYSFCRQMSKYYDITVVYDSISPQQMGRLMEICPVVKNDPSNMINCDTLIINSILDKTPKNIICKKSIQMVHCIKQQNWKIPQTRDHIVNVSQASKDSFGQEAENGIVIHNLTTPGKMAKTLLLVSALRVGADDKQGNDERCVKFAKLLDKADINYVWLYFGDKPMKNEPKNMIYCGMRLDLKPFIAKADYLVQLSGSEAFSYSLLEALELQTPVIVTPLEQNKDMRIVDGENAYIVPFEVEGFDVKKILKVPEFTYKHDNATIIKQWRKLLGDSKPKGNYNPKQEVEIEVIREYRDLMLNELLPVKTRRTMKFARALELVDKGLVRMV